MNKAQSGWTEDRLAKLRELWDKKLSITKIGEELGVLRNAVAGKAHRLGLEKSKLKDYEFDTLYESNQIPNFLKR